MFKTRTASAVLLGVVLMLFGGIFYTSVTKHRTNPPRRVKHVPVKTARCPRFVHFSPAEVRRQRNQLSTILNSMKLDFGKLACEIEEFKNKEEIKSTGRHDEQGCERSSAIDGPKPEFDSTFADTLVRLWFNKTVAIFGDPPGTYKKYLDSKNRLKLCASYDGHLYAPEISDGAVEFLDLYTPQYGLPVFDWILLFMQSGPRTGKNLNVLVDNIVRHDRSGLVLVWTGKFDANKNAVVHRALKRKGMTFENANTRMMRENTRGDMKEKILVYNRTNTLPNPVDA